MFFRFSFLGKKKPLEPFSWGLGGSIKKEDHPTISWENGGYRSDCLANCQSQPGPCSWCGTNGYCCSGDPSKSHLNAGCDDQQIIIAAQFYQKNTWSNTAHICISKHE